MSFDRQTPVIFQAAVLVTAALLTPVPVQAQQGSVVNTVHNLSISGPGEIKSNAETEVCKFCHVPHNPILPRPLWGHALSQGVNYNVPQVSRGKGARAAAPQPDGSSRMCLSCHDGTVALGDVAGRSHPIPMAGAQRLKPGRKGFIGTDLSGSHPISFVVPDGQEPDLSGGRDMGVKPLAAIMSDSHVRLDDHGKMQCTTCHDPHSDSYYEEGKIPRFWVKPTVEAVCLTCHELN